MTQTPGERLEWVTACGRAAGDLGVADLAGRGAGCRIDRRAGTAAGVMAGLSGVGGVVCVASAQGVPLRPPENEEGIKGKPFSGGFILLVCVAAVLAAAFLKSKRGHQD